MGAFQLIIADHAEYRTGYLKQGCHCTSSQPRKLWLRVNL